MLVGGTWRSAQVAPPRPGAAVTPDTESWARFKWLIAALTRNCYININVDVELWNYVVVVDNV